MVVQDRDTYFELLDASQTIRQQLLSTVSSVKPLSSRRIMDNLRHLDQVDGTRVDSVL